MLALPESIRRKRFIFNTHKIRKMDLSTAIKDQLLSSNDDTSILIQGKLILDRKDRLNDDNLITLLQSLQTQKNIGSLSLSCHELTSKSLPILGEFVNINSSSLQHLDIPNNGITNEHLDVFLLHCHSLVSLNLSYNVNLSKQSGVSLSNCLTTNKSLKSLYLNNVGFDLTAILAVITSLSENSTLEILELNRPLINNSTKEEICDHISRLLLYKTSRLYHISLRQACIHDRGIKHITESLYITNKLRHLDLESNKISFHGIEFLCAYLSSPQGRDRGLESLCLSYNGDVGDKGGLALAKVFT